MDVNADTSEAGAVTNEGEGTTDEESLGTPADAPEVLVRADDLVTTLGRFVRRFHNGEIRGPAASPEQEVLDVDAAMTTAAGRIESGLVDAAAFDVPYRAQAPQRLLDIAADLASRLDPIDPVAVHGALTLADLRIANGEVVAWPEVPSRVGDPYVDIAALARALAVALGPAAVPAFVDAVGIERPDPVRLEVWVLLGQLGGATAPPAG